MIEFVGLLIVWAIVVLVGAICVGIPFVGSGFILIQRVDYTEQRAFCLLGLSLLPAFGLPLWFQDLKSPTVEWINYVWPIVFAPGAVFSLMSVWKYAKHRARWTGFLFAFGLVLGLWTMFVLREWNTQSQIPPHPSRSNQTHEWVRVSRRMDNRVVAYSALKPGVRGTLMPDFILTPDSMSEPCLAMTGDPLAEGTFPITAIKEENCLAKRNYSYFVPGPAETEYRWLDPVLSKEEGVAQAAFEASRGNAQLKTWLKQIHTTMDVLQKSPVQTYILGESDLWVSLFKPYKDLGPTTPCQGPAIVWKGKNPVAVVPACVASFRGFEWGTKTYVHFLTMDYSGLRPGSDVTTSSNNHIYRLDAERSVRVD